MTAIYFSEAVLERLLNTAEMDAGRAIPGFFQHVAASRGKTIDPAVLGAEHKKYKYAQISF